MESGNYLRYGPGAVIQPFCDPFIKILYRSYKDSRCENCLELSPNIKFCASCLKLGYCSRNCQKAHWKLCHKTECNCLAFKNYVGDKADVFFMYFRIWATVKQNPELAAVSVRLYDGSYRSFNDLLATDFFPNSNPLEDGEHKELVEVLGWEDSSATFDLLKSYTWILRLNAFHICDLESVRIGNGIYIQSSIFKHSCKPNAFCWVRGSQLQIRAIGHIYDDGEPRIRCIRGHQDRNARQSALLDEFGFKCDCELCESHSDAHIDYKELNRRLETFYDPEKAAALSWVKLYKLHKEILETLREIYHPFDESVTILLKRTLEYGGGQVGHTASRELTMRLIRIVQKNLLMTYGRENNDYKDINEWLSTFSPFIQNEY